MRKGDLLKSILKSLGVSKKDLNGYELLFVDGVIYVYPHGYLHPSIYGKSAKQFPELEGCEQKKHFILLKKMVRKHD